MTSVFSKQVQETVINAIMVWQNRIEQDSSHHTAVMSYRGLSDCLKQVEDSLANYSNSSNSNKGM